MLSAVLITEDGVVAAKSSVCWCWCATITAPDANAFPCRTMNMENTAVTMLIHSWMFILNWVDMDDMSAFYPT